MRKIINGKAYDTKTSECIGNYTSTWDIKDLSYVSETLYRKRTCEFFLYGEGGPMSKYAVLLGQNNWGGGSKIIPLSWDAAREWAEKNLTAEKYEAIFGKVADDNSRVTITLSLSASAIERAKRSASKAGVTLSAYIESLL